MGPMIDMASRLIGAIIEDDPASEQIRPENSLLRRKRSGVPNGAMQPSMPSSNGNLPDRRRSRHCTAMPPNSWRARCREGPPVMRKVAILVAIVAAALAGAWWFDLPARLGFAGEPRQAVLYGNVDIRSVAWLSGERADR